jgi:hypothetical protein
MNRNCMQSHVTLVRGCLCPCDCPGSKTENACTSITPRTTRIARATGMHSFFRTCEPSCLSGQAFFWRIMHVVGGPYAHDTPRRFLSSGEV